MNRRMVKAKAARKWHAARERQVQRFVAAATARVLDSLAASIQAHATLGDMMRDAARAMQGFVVEAVAQRAVRRVVASLAPGQLFARLPGGELQHLGQTGPLVLERSQPVFCGVCGQAIRHDPWTGTTCACAQGAP